MLEFCTFLHSSVGSDDVLLKYRNYLVDFEGKLNMLFKSTTGDLSNKKDCLCAILTKFFGKNQRKLYNPP